MLVKFVTDDSIDDWMEVLNIEESGSCGLTILLMLNKFQKFPQSQTDCDVFIFCIAEFLKSSSIYVNVRIYTVVINDNYYATKNTC